MNAAKITLISTVAAAAFGLTLALTAAPAEAKPRCDVPPCKGGGSVSNPDDFQAECDKLFNLPVGSCKNEADEVCLFDVNVGSATGNPVMKISLIQNCTTDTMLVLPNFLDPGLFNPNFPSSIVFEDCDVLDPGPDCPPPNISTLLDGGGNTLMAVGMFIGDAVIANSTNQGDIEDITIDIAASNAGCDVGDLLSAINFDLEDIPRPMSTLIEFTKFRILGTTVTGGPLCDAIVIQNAAVRWAIVHNSIVAPEAYTDAGILFRDLSIAGPDNLANIDVGSSTIGRPAGGLPPGTAVEFVDLERGSVHTNIIKNESDDAMGTDVPGTGVLLQGVQTEFTIKNNIIKGGDVGIDLVNSMTGLITKNTIVGDDPGGPFRPTVGISCTNSSVTVRGNNTIDGYDTEVVGC